MKDRIYLGYIPEKLFYENIQRERFEQQFCTACPFKKKCKFEVYLNSKVYIKNFQDCPYYKTFLKGINEANNRKKR